MPQINFRIHILQQQFLDSDTSWLGEALCFPEITTADTTPDDVAEILLENVARLLPEVSGLHLWQRMQAGPIETLTLSLPIDPAERSVLWRELLQVTLYDVRWQKSADLHLMFLPSLGIEVVANTHEELSRLAEDQVRMELVRRKANRSLEAMFSAFRCSGLAVLDHQWFAAGLGHDGLWDVAGAPGAVASGTSGVASRAARGFPDGAGGNRPQ
jgi:hypothetical protein